MPFLGDIFSHLFDWEKDPQRQEKIVNSRLEAEFDGVDTGLSAVAARVTAVEGGAVANDSISNAELANMAESTIKGRAAGAGTGDPTDLTEAQTKTVLGLATTTTDNAVARFDSTAGNTQNSGVIVDDSNNVSGVVGLAIGHVTIADSLGSFPTSDTSSRTYTLASGATQVVANVASGLLCVTDNTITGSTAVFVLGGNALALLGQSTGTTWVASSTPGATQFGVFFNSNQFLVKNGTAGSATFSAHFLKNRAST